MKYTTVILAITISLLVALSNASAVGYYVLSSRSRMCNAVVVNETIFSNTITDCCCPKSNYVNITSATRDASYVLSNPKPFNVVNVTFTNTAECKTIQKNAGNYLVDLTYEPIGKKGLLDIAINGGSDGKIYFLFSSDYKNLTVSFRGFESYYVKSDGTNNPSTPNTPNTPTSNAVMCSPSHIQVVIFALVSLVFMLI